MPGKSLLQPQEIEVFYIIPTVRRQLAIAMKQRGLKQKQIAVLLDIEDAAVSQYINQKRGNKVQFEKEIIKEINKSSKLIKDKLSLVRETQKLLRLIHSTGEICRIHKQICKIPEICSPKIVQCFEDEKDVKTRPSYR